jgi:peptide/nickel transport system ATP-binding protein
MRNRFGQSIASLAALLAFCVAGPLLWRLDPASLNAAMPLAPPGWAHPLGTDALGRDELARLMQGGRETFIVAIPATALAFLLATLYGLAAGAAPPLAGRMAMRLLDALLALPSLLVLLCGAALLPLNVVTVSVLIGVTAWPGLARQVRTELVALRDRDFAAAARQLGAGKLHMARAHYIPNMAPLLGVNAVFLLGDSVLALSALSFLGLGVPPPAASWGSMLQSGIVVSDLGAWWLILPPGGLITFTLFAAASLTKGRPGALPLDPAKDKSLEPILKKSGSGASGPSGSRAEPWPSLLLESVNVSIRGVSIIEDISLTIAAGEILAIAGESASGKTTTALAIPGLLPQGAEITGSILLGGINVADLSPSARATKIGVVFQDGLAALNPAMTVGEQIAEPMRVHLRLSRHAAWARAIDLLHEVGIDNAADRAADYPHMFSGGMRQRVMIAAALACNPSLLIADEPTSGLDGPSAEQILTLLSRLCTQRNLAVLLVSHDVALAARHAHRAAIFYAGRCVELGNAEAVLRAPLHRYTSALLNAAPRVGGPTPASILGSAPEPGAWPPGCRFAPRCNYTSSACTQALPTLSPRSAGPTHLAACIHPAPPATATPPPQALPRPASGNEILRADSVTVRYRPAWLAAARIAVYDVSFTLARGECLALIGASGAGKSSLVRALLQLAPHDGRVLFHGADTGAQRGAARRRIQLLFQNPAGSIDPRHTAGDAIGEALALGGQRDASARRVRAAELLLQVGLPPALLDRPAITLSGGQVLRVAIARALAADPEILLLDEPTAGLDPSTAAGILALLRDLADRRGLAYIVITHDLAVASLLAHRLAVMHEGHVVETGPTAEILQAPVHPHTSALVAHAAIL